MKSCRKARKGHVPVDALEKKEKAVALKMSSSLNLPETSVPFLPFAVPHLGSVSSCSQAPINREACHIFSLLSPPPLISKTLS